MRSNVMLLVRILLTSSGFRNTVKYEKDGKKRKRAVGGFVGSVILYAFIAAVLVLMTAGMGMFGFISGVPAVCALIISALELIFGILRTGGYLFSKKDYEIITSLPFSIREQVFARFIAMYIKNLPSDFVFSMAMMAGYGYFARPPFIVYLIWIILTVFLPLIPTVIASVIGVLSTGIGAGAKHKTVVQSVFIFIFSIAFIFFGQVAGQLFGTSERAGAALTVISDIGETAGGAYLPVKWFSDAVTHADPIGFILMIAVSVLVFAAVFMLISRFYRRISSRLFNVRKSGKKYRMEQQKTRSVIGAIAFKEFRRMMGSSVYLTNMCVGLIIVLILSVVVLFVDINWLFSLITHGAPVSANVIVPAIPLILFFFVGMVPTTAVSWSLEGRNFWILQSLPLTKDQICRGKMRFSMLLMVPFMLIGSICFGISLRTGVPIVLLYMLCGVILCMYSTAFGMRCNLRHVNMDWDKETEVVKQGSSVTFYLLPNMFITMGAAAAAIFLGLKIGTVPVLLIICAVYAGVAALLGRSVRSQT